jgi:Uncharacterized conserved protein
MTRITGGCLCGAVRYHFEAEPINQRVCHCRVCQKAIGAAFNARILMRIEDVTLEGPAATHYSSEELERGFCTTCGTSIFSRRRVKGIMGICAGTLDDPSCFKPDMHFWVSSKQPWVVLADGLPAYPEAPPA